MNCPRLIKVIFDEFLPLSWNRSLETKDDSQAVSEDEVAHGRPQVTALKLILALCSAGRNLTAQLVRNCYKFHVHVQIN